MAIQKIEYINKVALQDDETVPVENKITDSDMNEIKRVVNNNADEMVNQIEFDELENTVDELENTVDEQNEEIEALQTKVTNLEETVNSELEDGTAEGTEITVNDSAVADASLLPNGNIEQTQYEGNNFFKPINSSSKNGINFTNNNDGSYTFNGTATSNVSFYITNVGYSGGSYTLNANNKVSNSGVRIQLETSQDNKILQLSNVDKYEVYNVVDINALSIIITSGTSLSNFVIYPQLLKGSYTSQTMPDFEPYVGGQASPNSTYTQPVHVLKGSNTLRIFNKNLFCKENANVFNGYIDANTDKIAGSTTAKSIYIPCKPNTSYMVSKISSSRFRIADILEEPQVGVDIEKKSNNLGTITEYPFTTGNNAKYLFVTIYNSTTDTLSLEDILSSLQIEYGSTVTDYVEGKEQIKTLTLPSGMEMCKIGDYKDEFVKDLETGKWYKDEKINKAVFDGSEDWKKYGSSKRFYLQNLSDIIAPSSNTEIAKIICNSFTVYSSSDTSSNTNIDGISVDTAGVLMIRLAEYNDKTLDEFKTWLSTHNVGLYYVRLTPQLIEITDETLISELDELLKLRTYYGQTNITVEAEDAKPFMTLNYKKSNRVLRSEIDTIKARLDLLEN